MKEDKVTFIPENNQFNQSLSVHPFVSLDGDCTFDISWIPVRHIKIMKFIKSFGITTKKQLFITDK